LGGWKGGGWWACTECRKRPAARESLRRARGELAAESMRR
jgi:hypothetical protein